jgi:hypothetical protein
MMDFHFLLGEEAALQILWMDRDDQWTAIGAIESISRNPVVTGLPHWRAEDGREHYLRSTHGFVVTFWVDHADRCIRIVAIDPA